MRRRKSLIQVAPSNDRPPIIQEYFDWPPIRDPSENKKALFNDTTDRTRRNVDGCWASDEGEGEYRETNGHRSSAGAKQLVKIEPDNSGAIAKILSESCTEFVSLRRRSFCLRQMHNDPEWLIGRKLSRPSDDEFLYIVVEIFFAVRKRIQTMKELGDFLDPNLDRIRGRRRRSSTSIPTGCRVGWHHPATERSSRLLMRSLRRAVRVQPHTHRTHAPRPGILFRVARRFSRAICASRVQFRPNDSPLAEGEHPPRAGFQRQRTAGSVVRRAGVGGNVRAGQDKILAVQSDPAIPEPARCRLRADEAKNMADRLFRLLAGHIVAPAHALQLLLAAAIEGNDFRLGQHLDIVDRLDAVDEILRHALRQTWTAH